MVILGFFSAFTQAMLPRLSHLVSEGEEFRFRELINRSFRLVFMLSIPLIACSMVLAPQIIYLLSGYGYEGAILPMRIIMPAVLCSNSSSISYTGFNTNEKKILFC